MHKNFDDQERLSDRVLAFEENETNRRLMPGIPFIVQFFSDVSFSETQKHSIDACQAVMEELRAVLGYVYLSEVTIVVFPPPRWADVPFGGYVQKLLSISTSVFAYNFHASCLRDGIVCFPRHEGKVHSVPNQKEVIKFIQHKEKEGGVFIKRVETTRTFTPEEIDKLPPKHAARANPGLVVRRFAYAPVRMPKLSEAGNLAEALFGS